MADAAAGSTLQEMDPVPIPRVAPDYESLRWPACRKGVRAYLRPRLASALVRRLRERVELTEFMSPSDLNGGALGDADEQTARAGRALRLQLGDERRSEACCPFGCVGGDGKPARYTWWHVCFLCAHEPICAARVALVEAEVSFAEALGGAMHACGRAVKTIRAEPRVTERWQAGSWEERRTRRFMFNCVQSTEEAKINSDKQVKKAARALTRASVALQQVGKAEARETEEQLEEGERRSEHYDGKRIETRPGRMSARQPKREQRKLG